MLVPTKLKRAIKSEFFARVRLQWRLKSGVIIAVRSQADWIMFNDIFTDREYDEALLNASETRESRPLRVLDLGANTGFFALRCADLFFDLNREVDLVSIEASPSNYLQLNENFAMQASHCGRFCPVLGLVGDRTGWAHISEQEYGFINKVGDRGPRIEYVDLDRLTATWAQIDLVKCDIEGSETAFLHNYPALLSKTRTIVLELHPNLGTDSETCRRRLRALGFENESTLRTQGDASTTELFWKSI